MKSPHQASAKSTPKPINATKGFSPKGLATGRCTPTSKKSATLYNKQTCC